MSFITGNLFGVGLLISGMTRMSKIQGFLVMSKYWDPTLIFVMVGAVGMNIFTFHMILKKTAPLYSEKFSVPTNQKIDLKLILGACIFGLGWGLGSLCPGPGMIDFFAMGYILFWILGLGIG